MIYATPLNLLDRFGDTEMAQLAAPENNLVTGALLRLTIAAGDRSAYTPDEQAAADQALARLTTAIADAGHQIDSYLAPRYPLPLETAMIEASNLGQVCADIARYNLMDEQATDEVERRYDRRITWLRDVSQGRASLGAVDTGVATPAGRPVVAGGQSAHDWDSY